MNREQSTRPEFLDWTPQQKNAAAAVVLEKALRQLLNVGWCRPYFIADLGNGPKPSGVGLIEAVKSSAVHESGIDTVHAISALRKIEFDLKGWESHPTRTQAEVLALLSKSVRLLIGHEPQVPRRGGWRIAS